VVIFSNEKKKDRMSDKAASNKTFKKALIGICVLFSILLLFCMFLLIEHTQMFPWIYLTDQKEKELAEFSERIMEAFDQYGKSIVISEHRNINRSRDLLTEKQLKMVDEMYQFCDTEGFCVIHASDKHKIVIYRHHIVFRYVIDYMYRNKSGIPEITTRKYYR